VSRQGQAIFAERVTRFAQEVHDPRVGAVARQVAAGVVVAVHGRPGVGRGTAARALAAEGVMIGHDADVDVHVIAEAVKPEDRAAIAASASVRPTVVVLNKADLIADPRGCAAHCRGLTGVPTVPMVAHLALASIDDGAFSALRELAASRVPLGSVDDVMSGPYRGLLEALDMFGIAQAVRASRAGADAAGIERVLHRRSGVREVVAALAPMLAEVGLQRVRRAVAALEVIAATADGDIAAQVDAFLRDDDTVLACMAAAVDAVQAAGMAVDPGDDPAAHLQRAAHWQRYRSGPVNPVHGACGDDIVRGSLRLWRRVTT